MPHKAAKLLQDVLDAGSAIQGFVAERSVEDYRTDLMLRSAVERQFEIIGEALSRLRRVDLAVLQRLEPYDKVIAFRNIIAHGYDVLDAAIVWQVIQEYLPELLDDAREQLRQLPDA